MLLPLGLVDLLLNIEVTSLPLADLIHGEVRVPLVPEPGEEEVIIPPGSRDIPVFPLPEVTGSKVRG